MESLQERLKNEAIGLDACSKGIDEWGNPTLEDMCEKFHTYQDFCIEKNWPRVEEFDNVALDMLLKHGIAHRGVHTLYAPNRIVVLGNAEVMIEVPDFAVYRVFARHNAKVHIKLGAHSHMYISMYDNCFVDVKRKNHDSRLACSHFGGIISTPRYFDKVNEK